MQSSNYYDVQINYNKIYNIYTGITYNSTLGSGPLLQGQISIKNNVLSANNTAAAPLLYNEFMAQGITVQNLAFGATAAYGTTPLDINIDQNTLDHVYNGISLTGYGGGSNFVNTIAHNDIRMRRDIVTGSAISAPQTAIYHSTQWNNLTSYVSFNTISDPDGDAPTAVVPYGFPVMEGIHVNGAEGYVECNDIRDLNTGIFAQSKNALLWNNNVMHNYAYGFVLDGSMSAGTTNQWITPSVGSWVGPKYQTYVMGGSTPTPINYLLPIGSVYDPTNNTSTIGTLGSYYGCTPGSGTGCGLILYTGPTIACTTTPSGTVSTFARPAHIIAARKQFPFALSTDQKNWIRQMQTWKTIRNDTTADTSAVLHTFKTMAANSRYKYLTDIEDNIMAGNYTAATSLLAAPIDTITNIDSDATTGVVMADAVAANNVVNNHKIYYGLLIKYQTDTMTSADSAQLTVLANKCPFDDGMIVLQARTLYNLVNCSMDLFSDIGCDAESNDAERKSGTGQNLAVQPQAAAEGQQYSLYPNPNDGNITLLQLMPDNAPVRAEVYNATGSKVYSGSLLFAERFSKLAIGRVSPGLYLLKLVDSKERTFMFKFVIE